MKAVSFLLFASILVVSISLFSALTVHASVEDFIESLISTASDANINDNDDDERGWTRLHKIAYYSSNPVEDINRLSTKIPTVLQNIDILTNGSGDPERTPLMLACERGNLNLVKFLIEEKKAEPEMADNRVRTALFYASRFGRHEVVKYLLQLAVENKMGIHAVTTADFMKMTPFLVACQNGAYKVVEEFARSFADSSSFAQVVDARDAFHQTCLHHAALSGFNPLNVKADDAQTELDEAITSAFTANVDFVKTAQAVLAAKPDMMDTVDGNGLSAFHSACSGDNLDMVKFFVAKFESAGELSKRLVDEPAFANGGEIFIHSLARFGRVASARYIFTELGGGGVSGGGEVSSTLISKNFLDTLDAEEKTPLIHAAIHGHTAFVDFLFTLPQSQVDLRHKDVHKLDAFLYAALHGHLAVLQRLHFFDPSLILSSKDQYEHNALHLACWEGKSLPVVKFLVYYGKPLLTQRRAVDLLYPLHFAVQSKGNVAFDMVQYLVDEVDVDLADYMDASTKTPLDHAIELGKKEIEDFMRQVKDKKQTHKCRGRGAAQKKQEQVKEEEAKPADL